MTVIGAVYDLTVINTVTVSATDDNSCEMRGSVRLLSENIAADSGAAAASAGGLCGAAGENWDFTGAPEEAVGLCGAPWEGRCLSGAQGYCEGTFCAHGGSEGSLL